MLTTKNIIPDEAGDIDNATLMLIIGNFIDAFRSAETENRPNMVKDEPLKIDNVNPYARAMIAGMVSWLCNRYGMELKKPEWIYKDKYFLDSPHFALNAQGDLKYLLFVQSPPELRTRNIFTSYNVFQRV